MHGSQTGAGAIKTAGHLLIDAVRLRHCCCALFADALMMVAAQLLSSPLPHPRCAQSAPPLDGLHEAVAGCAAPNVLLPGVHTGPEQLLLAWRTPMRGGKVVGGPDPLLGAAAGPCLKAQLTRTRRWWPQPRCSPGRQAWPSGRGSAQSRGSAAGRTPRCRGPGGSRTPGRGQPRRCPPRRP